MRENKDAELSTLSKEELISRLVNANKRFDRVSSKIDKLTFVRNVIILFVVALFTLAVINRTGAYPWGSDTYGHLFKGNILYDAMKKGKLFLNYNESWYNGVQPFRYWAPLPYYILAITNLITNNIITTYNIYIAFTFFLGGLGWLCFGYYLKRQNFALVIAILWFFVPNNLRILFSEGNIPYTLVNALIPFVFYYYYKSVQERKIRNYITLSIIMSIITLTHAMLAAMTGISLFILASIDSIVNKNYYKNLISLIYAFLGVMMSSFWLYPGLKGGIMSIDKGAVADVMKDLTYPLSLSLNPILRFKNIEIYYFGLAFAITAVFGLFFSTKKQRAPFISALVILLGTTKVALPFLQKLPMNQLFWMSRFTSISMAMIVIALLLWKNLRKSVLIALISLLIIDSSLSFYVLGFNGQFPLNSSKTIDTASRIATQRIGVLDSSQFGSFPSYYIAYNSAKGVTDQVYGWAWQGAATAKNIVTINTALEQGYYGLMFDRVLELGADSLIVKKSIITDFKELENAANIVGYKKYQEDDQSILYKYPSAGRFGTRVTYEGITIGSYSANAMYFFPKLQAGDSNYIDDYSYEQLKGKKVIYLSGFKYKDKDAAENLILKLSRNGVKVVIDITGMEEEFLGVRAEPITIKSSYEELHYKNQKLKMKDFPQDNTMWKTSFIGGIDNKESYGVVEHKLISYIGNKDNENLNFIGLNLPYYAFLTKDEKAIKILEDAFNLKAYEIPKREIHPIKVAKENDVLTIDSDDSNVIIPTAALDAFKKVQGDYDVSNNLIHLKTPKLLVKVIYPYLVTGIILSVTFLIITIVVSLFIFKNIKKEEKRAITSEKDTIDNC